VQQVEDEGAPSPLGLKSCPMEMDVGEVDEAVLDMKLGTKPLKAQPRDDARLIGSLKCCQMVSL
jgi:hypothetical protein